MSDLSAWLNSGELTVDPESGRLVDPAAVSYRIGLARREAGFTQEEAAAKFRVSPGEIQAWEAAGESYAASDPVSAQRDRITLRASKELKETVGLLEELKEELEGLKEDLARLDSIAGSA